MAYSMTQEATNTRRRWGCTCGCVIILGSLLLAAGIIFAISLKTTKPVPREQMAAPNTALYGEVHLGIEDSGMGEVMRTIVGVKAPQVVHLLNQDVTGKFIIPQGTVIVDETTEGQWSAFGVIQPANAFTRYVIREALGAVAKNNKEAVLRDTDGAQILSMDNGKWGAAIGKKSLVFGPDNQRLVDLANGTAAEDMSSTGVASTLFSSEMQKTLKQLDTERPAATEDATIVMGNRAGRGASLLKWVEEEADYPGLQQDMLRDFAANGVSPDNIEWLRLGVDIQTADRTIFELTAACPETTQAEAIANVLKNWIPTVVTKKMKQLTVTPEVSVRGTRGIVRTTVDGLKTCLPQAKK